MIFTPRTASEIIGKMVPQNVANAIPRSNKLLKRKPASLERNESNSFLLLSKDRRETINAVQETIIKKSSPRK